MRKVIVLVLVLLSVMATTMSAKAQGDSPGEKTFEEVMAEYSIEVVPQAPAGVTPIAVTSPEELEALMQQMVARNANSDSHVDLSDPAPTSESDTSPQSVTYGTVTRSCSVRTGVSATFNTWADIYVGYSGSFRWIESVLNTRTGLTGVTLGLQLSDAYSYSYGQTGSSVSIKGGGIVKTYIILPTGETGMTSEPISCSFTYNVY